MRLYRLLLLSFTLLSFLNCASYWANRKNDLQDIMTLGVEKPGYGAGVRIGPIAAGFVFQGGKDRDGSGKGYGLRGGHLGQYHSRQLVFGILGGETFYGGTASDEALDAAKQENTLPALENERDNLKSHKVRYFTLYNDPVKDRRKRKKEAFQRAFVEKMIADTGDENLRSLLPEENSKPSGYPASYLFQLDFYFGVHYGLRVGINFAELFDFIFGLAGLDMLGDDVE